MLGYNLALLTSRPSQQHPSIWSSIMSFAKSDDSQLKARWTLTMERIRRAEARYNRHEGCVALLAVSKTFSSADIRHAAELGQQRFGENYVQEALPKLRSLIDLDLEWHFIGHVQSNKTAAIAEHFNWVHSVDRLKIAQRLSTQRPSNRAPLQICLEVNVSGERSKSGCALTALSKLALEVAKLPQLQLRGLMALPALTGDMATQRAAFRRLRVAMEELIALGIPVDTLSMGTSSDLEAAIAEGATLVRVGTAIFGERAVGTSLESYSDA